MAIFHGISYDNLVMVTKMRSRVLTYHLGIAVNEWYFEEIEKAVSMGATGFRKDQVTFDHKETRRGEAVRWLALVVYVAHNMRRKPCLMTHWWTLTSTAGVGALALDVLYDVNVGN